MLSQNRHFTLCVADTNKENNSPGSPFGTPPSSPNKSVPVSNLLFDVYYRVGQMTGVHMQAGLLRFCDLLRVYLFVEMTFINFSTKSRKVRHFPSALPFLSSNCFSRILDHILSRLLGI